jgi:formylglycine-generating enzyme required for sulfatase activity
VSSNFDQVFSIMNRQLIGFALIALLGSSVRGEQYAFLVGVRDYSLTGELTSLKYTEDDVHTLAETLGKSGIPAENIVLLSQRAAAKQARLMPTSAQIRREFDLLISELRPGDSIIVGFSGHGLQFKNDPVNYFCPVDAKPDDKATLISLAKVYQDLEACKAQTKLLLVDACRDDPLSGLSKSAKRIELESVSERETPVLSGGTIAIFSCSATQQSFESPELAGGVFFHFVNRALAGEADDDGDKAVDLLELEYFTIKSVQKWARVNLGRKQIPERRGAARGAMELVNFDRAKPIERMPIPQTPLDSRAMPKSITNSIGMKLVLIPAGSFMMGSPTTEKDRLPNEVQHRVTLTKDFYLGTTEVTQGQWESVMGTTPWKGMVGANFAATYVSWEDAVEFCKRLSSKEDKTYRLPTEAEWEYACRSGTSTAYSFGANDANLRNYGWYGEGVFGNVHEVGLKRANSFGLFDVHGNVWEWCSDWLGEYPTGNVTNPPGPSEGSYRVARGGSWRDGGGYDVAGACRSAVRGSTGQDFVGDDMGFRVAEGR